MNRFLSIMISTILLLFITAMISCQPEEEPPQMDEQALVERGEYLVTLGGCNDCHTPKIFSQHGLALDTTRLLAGHPQELDLPEVDLTLIQPGRWFLMNQHLTATVGPWGVSFAANLTPDEKTGGGLWTEDMFIKAMRTGKHLGEGRPILPPMPWESLGKATDEDLKAIFAYLQSLKPVQNQVPQPIPLEDLMDK